MLLSTLLPVSFAATYALDLEHSTIGFEVSSALYNAKGRFTEWEGEVTVPDDGDLNGLSGTFTVQISSLSTDHSSRDNLLRTSDYFAVPEFPVARFVIDDALVTDETQLYVLGTMTIKDRSHPLDFHLEVRGDPPERLRFTGEATLSRKRFGLLTDYLPNPIEDSVTLSVDLNVRRQPDAETQDSTDPPPSEPAPSR